MELIDTHQHLIYRETLGYGWTRGIPQLEKGDFTLGNYQTLTTDKKIAGTVFMECAVDDAEYKDEARLVAGLMRTPGSGIMAQIASCRPEVQAGFSDWLDEAAELGAVGFRRVLHVVPDEVSQDAVFREAVREIGRRGFSFDLCVLARQLPIAQALAQACPDTVMILNHCGVPDIAAGAFDNWAEGMAALARCDNMQVKLSGLTAYCAPDAMGTETLRPWVDHVLGCFGPDRMVWGGDWPVVNMGSGLPAWIDLSRALLSSLSQQEAQAVGTGNARRIYRLGQAPLTG
ncbi:MAG: amidohydrolase [Rhodobacteraceae bacterium]|nr:MAG: amidohydrolase [Paracoccaceae bacterium]